MAKSSSGLGWKGVASGTPCADPKDNNNDYNPKPSVGSWEGVKDTTPSASGKSQSIKIGSGGKGEE